MPRGSVAQSETRSVADAQNRTLELVQDPTYITRLRSKLIGLLTDEGPNGTVHLGQAFQQLDRQFAARRAGSSAPIRKSSSHHALNLWTFKALFAPLGLSDVEGEVLFALFLDDQEREDTFTTNDRDDGVASAIGTSSRMASSYGGGGAAGAGGRIKGDGSTIDGAEVMLAIRKMCHTISAQFHDILKTRIRSRRLDPQSTKPDGTAFCPFFHTFKRNGAAPSRRDVFDFLTFELGLTDSEAFLCLEYFSLAGDRSTGSRDDRSSSSSFDDEDDEGAPTNALDADYIIASLFEFPMPDDVAYPLLMSKLVEAITNPNRAERSGMTAVLEELLFYTDALDASGSHLLYGRKHFKEVSDAELERFEAEEEDDRAEDDGEADAGATSVRVPCKRILSTRWMDGTLFRKFCGSMVVGLPTGEVELLFGYLSDSNSGLLSFSTLFEQILLRYPTVPLAEVQRAASAVRAHLFAKQGPHALNQLHECLSRFQNNTVPPLQFCKAIRSLGIPGSVLPTVHVDAIRRVAGRCVQAVSLIRGPLPPARSETIEKLYLLLLEDSGLMPKQHAPQSHSSRGDDDDDAPRGKSHRALSSATRRDVGASPPPTGVSKADLLAIPVPKSAVLRRFEPELAPGLIPTVAAQVWRQHLERYLASLHDDSLDNNTASPQKGGVSRRLLDEASPKPSERKTTAPHAVHTPTLQFLELAYFWGNVSPSVEDDSQFTLLLWKSFSMHRSAPPSKHHSHSYSGAVTVNNSPAPNVNNTFSNSAVRERRLLRD